ncbi:MAG TPA: hypothetical protein VF503_04625 [Sphingobium sp.]|uniref:hypothetical protein n=1 Tax=Sphingobium sp. TaxID=1912891 RepID=UPI002ED4FF15
MLVLVQIDLSGADVEIFDAYEASVLALLTNHGARLEERVRAMSGATETHLLYFPDEHALDAFRNDPARAALQEMWVGSGAVSSMTEVIRLV